MIVRTKGNLRICSVTAIVYSISNQPTHSYGLIKGPFSFKISARQNRICAISEMPVLLILNAVANGIKLQHSILLQMPMTTQET